MEASLSGREIDGMLVTMEVDLEVEPRLATVKTEPQDSPEEIEETGDNMDTFEDMHHVEVKLEKWEEEAVIDVKVEGISAEGGSGGRGLEIEARMTRLEEDLRNSKGIIQAQQLETDVLQKINEELRRNLEEKSNCSRGQQERIQMLERELVMWKERARKIRSMNRRIDDLLGEGIAGLGGQQEERRDRNEDDVPVAPNTGSPPCNTSASVAEVVGEDESGYISALLADEHMDQDSIPPNDILISVVNDDSPIFQDNLGEHEEEISPPLDNRSASPRKTSGPKKVDKTVSMKAMDEDTVVRRSERLFIASSVKSGDPNPSTSVVARVPKPPKPKRQPVTVTFEWPVSTQKRQEEAPLVVEEEHTVITADLATYALRSLKTMPPRNVEAGSGDGIDTVKQEVEGQESTAGKLGGSGIDERAQEEEHMEENAVGQTANDASVTSSQSRPGEVGPTLKVFRCEECLKYFAHSRYLRSHLRMVHNAVIPRSICWCPECGDKFSSRSEITCHRRITHSMSGPFRRNKNAH